MRNIKTFFLFTLLSDIACHNFEYGDNDDLDLEMQDITIVDDVMSNKLQTEKYNFVKPLRGRGFLSSLERGNIIYNRGLNSDIFKRIKDALTKKTDSNSEKTTQETDTEQKLKEIKKRRKIRKHRIMKLREGIVSKRKANETAKKGTAKRRKSKKGTIRGTKSKKSKKRRNLKKRKGKTENKSRKNAKGMKYDKSKILHVVRKILDLEDSIKTKRRGRLVRHTPKSHVLDMLGKIIDKSNSESDNRKRRGLIDTIRGIMNLAKIIDIGKLIDLGKLLDFRTILKIGEIIDVGKIIQIGEALFNAGKERQAGWMKSKRRKPLYTTTKPPKPIDWLH